MIYLSGAISNDPNYREKFELYHKVLSKIFDDVIFNPVFECELRELTDWSTCMKFNLKILVKCKYMLIIKDGIKSSGVTTEKLICDMHNIRYNYIYLDDNNNLIIESYEKEKN